MKNDDNESSLQSGQRAKPQRRASDTTTGSSTSNHYYNKKKEPIQLPPSHVEILMEPSPTLKRPLSLINGTSYAVSLVDVKITQSQHQDNNGRVSKYKEPKIVEATRMIVFRGDGKAFGDVSDKNFSSLASLKIKLELPDLPPRDRLWSSKGVKKFLDGYRPDPVRVFERVASVVDTYIDFDRSLSDQHTMCEFVACFILSTWFLDAFNVTGFLWPNGEKGSGKSNLLILISELGFLGQFISASGTFASLRDLADCGATLCFDDAENFSDPRKSDPDKRAMLLAGNHRGATVSLKEPTNEKGWKIRYVNTYCPRAFSAIHLPDPTLASRTIIIPLTRTVDKTRANRDPLDMEFWPYDRRELVDDLWAMALIHLPQLVEWDRWVGEHAQLKGRALQPWRSTLATAKWLDENGCEGLCERMQSLSVLYQTERLNIEAVDVVQLVIRAIFRCAIRAKSAISANKKGNQIYLISSSDVAEMACEIADEEDLDISKERLTSRTVGRILSNLRLSQIPRSGGKGKRTRQVSLKELTHLGQAYGLELPGELITNLENDDEPHDFNGSDGSNGSIGTYLVTKRVSRLWVPEEWELRRP